MFPYKKKVNLKNWNKRNGGKKYDCYGITSNDDVEGLRG